MRILDVAWIYLVIDIYRQAIHVHTGARGERWTTVVQHDLDVPLTASGVRLSLPTCSTEDDLAFFGQRGGRPSSKARIRS